MKTGVLLINLGTPDAPTPEAVGRYLREFLMDGYVIGLPKPLRWFFVNVMIVPRRKYQSAAAYQKVQLPEGSPLLVHTRALAERVAARLSADDNHYVVEYAMRYGNPSIAASLRNLKSQNVSRIIVLPLYPQYAESSYRTAVESARRSARELHLDRLLFVAPFYQRSDFINALADQIRRTVDKVPLDHLLFSFHSLPVRHLKRLDATRAHCLVKPDCCAQVTDANKDCYRAQCMYTARAIAGVLGLKANEFSVSFQSRLGNAKWIEPVTEETLRELASRGVKRVAVACPSFVADCLETVEEIGIRGRETFMNAGGQELTLIPSLNSEPAWVEVVAHLVHEADQEANGRGSVAQ